MKNTRPSLLHGLNFLAQLAMSLAWLLLPLTSLPLLSKLMGGTLVAPPSIVFIFLLTVGWLPVYILRGGQCPREIQPFLLFLVVALVASAAGFFLPFPPYKGHSVADVEVRALVTLAIGSATYLVISLWHREFSQFRNALGLINIGGAIILAWSFVQLAVIYLRGGNYPSLMVHLQALLSLRSLLDVGFHSRLGGFTYEPSWLAHQLNMLFLPYWLAATITGFSTARKFLHLSVENLLLAGGMLVLFFSQSRIGLLAFLLIIAYGFYRFNTFGIGWLRNRLRDRPAGTGWLTSKWVPFLIVPAILIIFLAVAVGMLLLLAHVDPRTARLLLKWQSLPSNLLDLAFTGDFAERVVYWSIGWSVFARYPLLGVGLGNAGFFILQHLPLTAYRLPEVMSLINLAENLNVANTKSLWIRLLAETGLVGFSVFSAWQYVLWQAGRFLRANRSLLLRTLGWMGAFAVIALLAEGFSIDSFALPYIWVSMGLLTAASALARRETVS